MLIQVTADHIRHGLKGELEACPIARALREMGYEHVSVANVTMWRKGSQRFSCRAPQDMMDFMEQFDAGVPVAPASFIVEPVLDPY